MSSTNLRGPLRVDPVHRLDIIEIVNRTWWNIDRAAGVKGELFFVEDGIFVMPTITMTGRSEIARAYASRQSNGPRLSRHVVSNIILDGTSENRLSAEYIVTVHAQNGVAPLPLQTPQAIADVTDEFIRIDDYWLISRRVVQAVFYSLDSDSVFAGQAGVK